MLKPSYLEVCGMPYKFCEPIKVELLNYVGDPNLNKFGRSRYDLETEIDCVVSSNRKKKCL